MEDLLNKLPTLQSPKLIGEAFWDLTFAHKKMTKFLSDDSKLINTTQVNQVTYMKILANEALSIKNSINIANRCFGDIWKRDKKEQMKAAQTFQESCWEFFEPFTDQASIDEYLNIQL